VHFGLGGDALLEHAAGREKCNEREQAEQLAETAGVHEQREYRCVRAVDTRFHPSPMNARQHCGKHGTDERKRRRTVVLELNGENRRRR